MNECKAEIMNKSSGQQWPSVFASEAVGLHSNRND